ncbi:MAG: SRPBCC family protein [bacterium]
MARFGVTETIEVPVEKVWKLLRNFGDVSWFPGLGESARVEGEGVGMSRFFGVPGAEIQETLTAFDEDARTFSYEIPNNLPLPLEGYLATVVLKDAGANKTEIDWSCEAEPTGTHEEAEAAIHGMYKMLISCVRDAL